MYHLLRAALRERPEYIVVGEIRGAEAYVLFQAMSTGHTTYSTIHADSVQALVHRLENKPIDIPRVMIPALDAVVIQIQTRIGERRVRRAKQVVEIIGLDPHTGELLTNEVFRWIPATDEFEFSGKSYILEKVMVRTNMSKPQIMEELKNRKDVLDWLVENDIRAHMDVAKVIMEYYLRPEEVVRQVQSSKEEALPAARMAGHEVGGADAAVTLDGLANPGVTALDAGGAVIKEPCPSCGHSVRVDRPDCPKCGRKIR
jgi:flagellar protein FlaI